VVAAGAQELSQMKFVSTAGVTVVAAGVASVKR